MKTILLDRTTWDLVIDVSGNIALADIPYAQAQDASSMFRTFKGEVYYDTTLGISYEFIINKPLNLSYSRAKIEEAALLVPGITSAQVFFSSFENRVLSGQARMKNTAGQTVTASF